MRLNYRFALVLLTILGAISVGAWFLRRQSMARNAVAFLQFARSQQAAGETKEAMDSLRRFLSLVPNDPDGISLFAELTDGKRMGEDDLLTTYQILSDFVVRNPDRLDMRERLFQMSAEMQRYGELVENHLPRMREMVLENRDYTSMAVEAYRSLSRIEEAVQFLVAAIDKHPEMASRYGDLIQFLEEQELNAVDLANLYERFSGAAGEEVDSGSASGKQGNEEPLIDQQLRNLATGDEGGPARREETGNEFTEDGDSELRTPDGVVAELDSGRAPTLSVPLLVDRILEEALRKGSPPVDARVLRAKIQMNRGNFDKVLAELDEAEKIDPQDPKYLNQRIEYLTHERDVALASENAPVAAQSLESILALAKTADDSREGTWVSRMMLGQVLLDSGDLSTSEEQFRRAFELGQREKQQLAKSVIGRKESVRIDFLTHWGLVNSLIETVYRQTARTPEEEQKYQQMRAEINELIGAVRKLDALPSLIEFLEVRSLLVDRKWAEAAERFEEIRVGLADTPDIVRLLDRSLVECYQRLKNPDEAIRALRRAVTSDPSWVQGRLGLAEAYLRVGREDLAMDEYAQVSTVSAVPSVVLRLAIRREMGRPEEKREWAPIEEILDRELAKNPQNADLLAIQCDVLRFQNRPADGLELVRAARNARPEDDALVSLEVSQLLVGDPTDAAGNLDRAEELLAKVGRDSAILRLARARVEGARKGEGLGARLLALSENCENLPVAQRQELFEGLAAIASANGYDNEALKLVERDLSLDPENLEILAARATLLMQIGASAGELDSALSQVRDLDVNPKPNYHYLAGMRDLRDYRALGDSDLENVRVARMRLLRAAEQSFSLAVKGRPSWVAARSQLSQVLYELGEEEPAFRVARELLSEGTATPEAVANAVRYLLKNQRHEELLEVVRDLEQKQPLLVSEEVARAGMVASYRSRRWDETLLRIGRLDSSTVEDLLIQAQLLIARRGDAERIEELLTKALTLAPNQRMAWFLWVSFLIREQRLTEARGVLDRIKMEVPDEPPQLRPWTLAQCEELLGDLDQADQHYEEAHRDNVANLQILNEHIGFRVRHNRQQGAQALLKVLADPASGLDDEIRRQAEILRNKLRGKTANSYAEFEEALSALQANADLSQVSEEQLRAQLELFADVGRSREQRRMIAILEELGARKVLSSLESMELARLYSRNWRWADAVVMYRRILEREPDNVRVHASFIEAALRRSQLDDRTAQDVSKSVSQLALRDPESLRTLDSQVRWLNHEGKSSETEFLIRQFLKVADRARPAELFRELMETERAALVLKSLREAVAQANDTNSQTVVGALENRSLSSDDPQVIAALAKYIESPKFVGLLREQMWHRSASLAEMSGQLELTEELYTKIRDDSKTIEGAVEYLSFLSRRARFGEALELWERIRAGLPIGIQARTLAAIVRAGKAPSEVCSRAEGLLRDMLTEIPNEKTDEQIPVLLALADLYDLQERFAEARAVYGRILESDPRNIAALNNLAILNSHADKPADRQRAVGLIDQAIEIVGPLPTLLDSRAMVKLSLDQLDSATQDLREALDQDSSPMFWLHLAYVQVRKNDIRGASESLERASDPKVDADKLHPLERPFFDELRRRLAPPGA